MPQVAFNTFSVDAPRGWFDVTDNGRGRQPAVDTRPPERRRSISVLGSAVSFRTA